MNPLSLQLLVLPCLWKRNICKCAFFCDHMCRLQKCVRQAIFSLSIRNVVSRLVVSLGTAAELVYTVHSLITKCWYALIILHRVQFQNVCRAADSDLPLYKLLTSALDFFPVHLLHLVVFSEQST